MGRGRVPVERGRREAADEAPLDKGHLKLLTLGTQLLKRVHGDAQDDVQEHDHDHKPKREIVPQPQQMPRALPAVLREELPHTSAGPWATDEGEDEALQ